MKHDSPTELKILSKRAQEFLSHPVHRTLKSFIDCGSKKWQWSFSFEKLDSNELHSDKILTLSYFSEEASICDLLILETLSLMVKGRDVLALNHLSFRELENFLRDENHLPVFENLPGNFPEESFKSVKNSLIVAILKNKLEAKLNPTKKLIKWEELSLVEQNKTCLAYVTLLNNLFNKANPLELVLASTDEISLILNGFPLSIEVIEGLLKEFIGDEQQISSFKVVAVQ